jgi:hypothetical protein
MSCCKICFKNIDKHNFYQLFKCDNIYSDTIKTVSYSFSKIYFAELNNIKINKFKKINDSKHYQCVHCNKIIINKQNYEIHIKNKSCMKQIKEYKCERCNKKFNVKKTLNYHLNNFVCKKIIKENDIANDNQQINNITNNTSNIEKQQNINNTNNIQKQENINNQIININLPNSTENNPIEMLPFRNSKYNISPKKYLEYAKNPEMAIKDFIKDQHFNPKNPERMNILDTNSRSNRINVLDYDDDLNVRWLLRSKENIYNLLYNRGVNYLFVAKNILSEHGIKLDIFTEQRLNEKIKEYENDEKSKKEQISMISDLTYNYRDMVATNKKSNKQLLNKLKLSN